MKHYLCTSHIHNWVIRIQSFECIRVLRTLIAFVSSKTCFRYNQTNASFEVFYGVKSWNGHHVFLAQTSCTDPERLHAMMLQWIKIGKFVFFLIRSTFPCTIIGYCRSIACRELFGGIFATHPFVSCWRIPGHRASTATGVWRIWRSGNWSSPTTGMRPSRPAAWRRRSVACAWRRFAARWRRTARRRRTRKLGISRSWTPLDNRGCCRRSVSLAKKKKKIKNKVIK